MAVGVVAFGIRFAWPHFAPASFAKASAAFLRISPYLPVGTAYRRDLGVFLLFFSAVFFLLGAFVFFRKAIWSAQERRYQRSQTELRLK